MPYKDPEKNKACIKAYYEKNKDIAKARALARYEAGRKHINKIKANPCSICGEIFTPSAMEFHHIDPDTKSRETSDRRALNPTWSIQRIDAEIEKCILVCANCHRLLHASVEEVLEFNIRKTTETQRDSCGVRRI